MANNVPGLDDARHVFLVDAQDAQLLIGPLLGHDVVTQAPAGHSAPVDKGVFSLQSGQMHEDVRAVVDELDALFLKGRNMLHEPAGKHGREHDVRLGVARFGRPDIQLQGLQPFYVVGRAAVQIIDVRRHGVSFGVDAGDAADDAVAHDSPHRRRGNPLFFQLAAARRHALLDEAVIFVYVHLHPAGMRIIQRRLGRIHSYAFHVLAVHGDLYALRPGVKSQIIFLFHIHYLPFYLAANQKKAGIHPAFSHLRTARQTHLRRARSLFSSRLYCRSRNFAGSAPSGGCGLSPPVRTLKGFPFLTLPQRLNILM